MTVRAGAALGVQVRGRMAASWFTYVDTGAQLHAKADEQLQAAITDAGFTLGSWSLTLPGVVTPVNLDGSYDFVARFTVAAWTDDAADTTSAIRTAMEGYAIVDDVTTYDAATGRAIDQPPSWFPSLSLPDISWTPLVVIALAVAAIVIVPRVLPRAA